MSHVTCHSLIAEEPEWDKMSKTELVRLCKLNVLKHTGMYGHEHTMIGSLKKAWRKSIRGEVVFATATDDDEEEGAEGGDGKEGGVCCLQDMSHIPLTPMFTLTLTLTIHSPMFTLTPTLTIHSQYTCSCR